VWRARASLWCRLHCAGGTLAETRSGRLAKQLYCFCLKGDETSERLAHGMAADVATLLSLDSVQEVPGECRQWIRCPFSEKTGVPFRTDMVLDGHASYQQPGQPVCGQHSRPSLRKSTVMSRPGSRP
jgi:hypothetical protein